MEEKHIAQGAQYILNSLKDYLVPEIQQLVSSRILELITANAGSFGSTKTILHRETVALEDIYYPLPLIHKTYDKAKKVDNFIQFTEQNKRISIIASGGSGKTTFLKYFYIECVKKQYKIPIIINFRDFNNVNVSKQSNDKNITENHVYISINQYLLFNKVSSNVDILEKMLNSGKFIFIMDGYDELDERIKTVITRDFVEFTRRFTKNVYIISTRPYTYAQSLEGFENIYLKGLESSEDIAGFIHKQLYNNTKQAEKVVETLLKSEGSKYLELVSNPLFLILFLNSFESYPKIPPKKTTFYFQVFNALYERHEFVSKMGFTRNKLSKLGRDDFERLIAAFSFDTYFQGNYSFTEDFFRTRLSEVIGIEKLRVSSSKFLEDLKVTVPIIIEDGIYLMFIHRSIQEYFCCRFLTTFSEKGKNDFLKMVAKDQNGKRNDHTFLLELISEMYPYEFKKFYIRHHIEEFYENRSHYFQEYDSIEGYEGVFNSFENFRLILSYSKEFEKEYLTFIKDNSFINENINIFIAAKTQKQNRLANEILVLFENKKKFYDLIKIYVGGVDQKSNDYLRIASQGRRQ